MCQVLRFKYIFFCLTGKWRPRPSRLCAGVFGRWESQSKAVLKYGTLCMLTGMYFFSVRFSCHSGEFVSSWTCAFPGLCHTSTHTSAGLLWRQQCAQLTYRWKQSSCPKPRWLERDSSVQWQCAGMFCWSQSSGNFCQFMYVWLWLNMFLWSHKLNVFCKKYVCFCSSTRLLRKNRKRFIVYKKEIFTWSSWPVVPNIWLQYLK